MKPTLLTLLAAVAVVLIAGSARAQFYDRDRDPNYDWQRYSWQRCTYDRDWCRDHCRRDDYGRLTCYRDRDRDDRDRDHDRDRDRHDHDHDRYRY